MTKTILVSLTNSIVLVSIILFWLYIASISSRQVNIPPSPSPSPQEIVEGHTFIRK